MDTPERPSGDGLKRRQSESGLSEQESKRQRVSPGKSSPTAPNDATSDKQDTPTEDAIAQAEPDPRREKRRKSGVADEKQRSKRLFGALLGNLNQPSDRTSKRRQEIESRRKAELQRQDDERLEDKQRRVEQLIQRRKKVQRKTDEQHMHIRHRNMLDAANFLQTTAEPRLYYRPWELRADEEDRIEDQIRDAQALIDKDLAKFDDQGSPDSASERQHEDDDPSTVKRDVGLPRLDGVDAGMSEPTTTGKDVEEHAQAKSDEIDRAVKPVEVPEANVTNHSDVNGDEGTTSADAVSGNAVEEAGDHVVEGDEDTVIY